MTECDYCGAAFEGRTQGKPGRFCPGSDHKRRYYSEGGREYARILKKRRAVSAKRSCPTGEGRLEILKKSVELAQRLEGAGHAVRLCARYHGEVHVEFWPVKGAQGYEYSSTPSPTGGLTGFYFLIDGKRVSFDKAAALLTTKAETLPRPSQSNEGTPGQQTMDLATHVRQLETASPLSV